MTFDDSVIRAQKYFPSLQIKYKDESPIMKLISKLVFFNDKFSNYATTLGQTIYISSKHRAQTQPEVSIATLCHELSHMYSSKKKTAIIYSLSYLFPQVLVFAAIPVFFFFSLFKSLLCLLFLLPLPSPTRTTEEKQAYTISLYAEHKMNIIRNTQFDLDEKRDEIIAEFKGPSYYFMWWLPGVDNFFVGITSKIKAGDKPEYDQELYAMVDDVIGN